MSWAGFGRSPAFVFFFFSASSQYEAYHWRQGEVLVGYKSRMTAAGTIAPLATLSTTPNTLLGAGVPFPVSLYKTKLETEIIEKKTSKKYLASLGLHLTSSESELDSMWHW